MNRKSKITYTSKFIKDYPYSYDSFDYFMKYWMQPFVEKIFNSRKEAHDAINDFIKTVKRNFPKFDYGNYIIPNISEKWFEIIDYKEEKFNEYYY